MDRYVFFDFDGTLTRRDTFFGFIRHLRGPFGMLKILFAESPSIIRGLLKGDESIAKERVLIRTLRGLNSKDYHDACESFAESIRGIERESVVKALDEALKEGCHVGIVSASIGDWIRPWARSHGRIDVIATECFSDGNEILGKFRTPNCIGPEKVNRILEKWPELSEQRAHFHVTAYGNSGGDKEMLAFADKAIKVGH